MVTRKSWRNIWFSANLSFDDPFGEVYAKSVVYKRQSAFADSYFYVIMARKILPEFYLQPILNRVSTEIQKTVDVFTWLLWAADCCVPEVKQNSAHTGYTIASHNKSFYTVLPLLKYTQLK